jgi:hypothetical protein
MSGWCMGAVRIDAYYSRVACMSKGCIFCYVRTSSEALPGLRGVMLIREYFDKHLPCQIGK